MTPANLEDLLLDLVEVAAVVGAFVAVVWSWLP
jgi:hypothetical protein